MRSWSNVLASCFSAAALSMAGCGTAPVVPPTGKPVAGQAKSSTRLPLGYQPLPGASDCFVESVHFYDYYLAHRLGGSKSWARVMRWATRKDDFTFGTGHAVTVFFMHGKLWIYDLNFGFLSLETSPDRRMDLTDVAPEIFAKYPHWKSLFATYEEDPIRTADRVPPAYSPKGKTGELQVMLTVAQTLGKGRSLRVVEFSYPAGGDLRTGVGTVFVFGQKLCFYHPAIGTVIVPWAQRSVGDLRVVTALVAKHFPRATNVRWFEPAG